MRLLPGMAVVFATTTVDARPLDDAACTEARSQRALSKMRACAPQLEADASPRVAAAYWMALAETTLDPDVEDRLGMDVRRDEAIAALGHAARLTPDDPEPLRRRARLADQAGDLRVLREVVHAWVGVAPDDPEGEAYLAVLAIEDGRWAAAEEAIDGAMDHGLAPARGDAIRADLDRRQPAWRRHRHLAVIPVLAVLLAWALRWRRNGRRPT